MILARLFRIGKNHRLSSRANPLPTPVEVAASQLFDGPDGPWSSFAIQVGTPAQTIRVLVSTASYQTFAVLPQGCTSQDPSNCESFRGDIFNPAQSRTWVENNNAANGTFSFDLESSLGYRSNALYGYDTLTLGWKGSGGPSLPHQIIAGIAMKDFYMGLFGVNPRPSNFTTFDDPVPSYLSSLKNNSIIPSLTYSYTSGNQYRLDRVFASLTLGGYDSSRFISNNVSFPFDKEDIRDLSVTINSITMTSRGSSTDLMSTSIRALIDSTVPYLYLPLAVCRKFEDAFGLTFDENVQAYLVNDSLHEKLINQAASVTFSLGNAITADTVNISLPYAAFDLIADYPWMPNKSRYFPLMPAMNYSQYTLGRTFLQEAYLIADYERFNFSISQCNWSAASQQTKIIPIEPVNLDTSQAHHHLSVGAIVGVVLGGVLAVLAIIPLLYRGLSNLRARFEVKKQSEIPELDEARRETSPGVGTTLPILELAGKTHYGAELAGEKHICFPELQGETGKIEADDHQNWIMELRVDCHTPVELPAQLGL